MTQQDVIMGWICSVVAVNVACAFLALLVAAMLRRPPGQAIVLGLLLGPLGIVIVGFLEYEPGQCPECKAGLPDATATRCRFCRAELPPQPPAPPKKPQPDRLGKILGGSGRPNHP